MVRIFKWLKLIQNQHELLLPILLSLFPSFCFSPVTLKSSSQPQLFDLWLSQVCNWFQLSLSSLVLDRLDVYLAVHTYYNVRVNILYTSNTFHDIPNLEDFTFVCLSWFHFLNAIMQNKFWISLTGPHSFKTSNVSFFTFLPDINILVRKNTFNCYLPL